MENFSKGPVRNETNKFLDIIGTTFWRKWNKYSNAPWCYGSSI